MQKIKSIKIENSGITLIALVITIIVLLILAGVALNALVGDSGILSNAEKAKEQTIAVNTKEQVALAVQAALTKGYAEGHAKITEDDLMEELNGTLGEGKYEITEGEATWRLSVGGYEVYISENGKIEKALPKAEGTTPWLPKGFSQVKGTDLSNGLTIANTSDGTPGTQNYVWIEVPATEQTITLSDGTTQKIHLAEAKTDEEIMEALELYAGKGTNADYTKGSSNQNYSSWKDEWYDKNGKTKETGATNLKDTDGCGMTYDEYQKAYSKMLNSIKKYGGFWLAQYEAGIAYEEGKTSTNRTKSSARIINPISANYAKDQYPYNWVYLSEAQKIANADSTSKYTSSIPFGIQWDLVCKYIEVKTALEYQDIATTSSWGNYQNTLYTPSSTAKYSIDYGEKFNSVVTDGITYSKIVSSNILLTTGAIESTTASKDASPMNIYDLAGNLFEWTLERPAVYVYGPCSYRGGNYGNNSLRYQASYRYDTLTTIGYDGHGFRSVLY